MLDPPRTVVAWKTHKQNRKAWNKNTFSLYTS
jgi:hypothetical protein